MLKKQKIQGPVGKWGGRQLKLEFTGNKALITPNRIINSTEINSRNNLLVLEGYESPIVECTRRVNKEFPMRFAKKNGIFAQTKRDLKSFVATNRGSEIIFRPQIPSGAYLDDRGTKMMTDLQIESGLEVITIQEFDQRMSNSTYIEKISDAIKYASSGEHEEVTVMPYISVDMEASKFESRFSTLMNLVDDGAINAIGISASSYDEYRSNYEVIREHKVRSRDVWIHGSYVLDVATKGLATARHHVPQMWGIDTVSSRVKSAPGSNGIGQGKDAPQIIKKASEYIRFFDRSTVELVRVVDGPNIISQKCDCGVCSGSTIIQAMKDRALDIEGTVDEANLRDFSRLHNLSMSLKEFKVSQTMCKSDELREYFLNKAGLTPYVAGDQDKKLMKKSVNKTLDDV